MAAARERYEAALLLDPLLQEAHEGLSYVLWRNGDEEGAERHRAIAFADRWLRTRTFRGPGAPIPVLLLISGKGGNVFTDFLLDDATFLVHELVVDYAPPHLQFPEHAFVFNAIADADRCMDALHRASEIVRGLKTRIVNDPDAVMRTSRVGNAARLAIIEGVRTAKIVTIDRNAAAPFGFPFLLRVPGHHTGRYFVRVDGAAELDAALRDLPGKDLLAIEYVETRSNDGLLRKYRMMIARGNLLPVHMAISRDWNVHYMHSLTPGNDRFEEKERRFLEDPETAIGSRAMDSLRRVAATLQLDYGGIDFGIMPDGRVAVFEANASMILLPAEADPYAGAHRHAAARVFAALRDGLLEAAAGDV